MSDADLTQLQTDLRNARRDRNILLVWIKAAEDIGKAVGYEHAEKESDPATFAKRVVECVARLRAEREQFLTADSKAVAACLAEIDALRQQLTAAEAERERLSTLLRRCDPYLVAHAAAGERTLEDTEDTDDGSIGRREILDDIHEVQALRNEVDAALKGTPDAQP